MKKSHSESNYGRVFKYSDDSGPNHKGSDHARVYKPHAMGGPVNATPAAYSPSARRSENLPNPGMSKGGKVKKHKKH